MTAPVRAEWSAERSLSRMVNSLPKTNRPTGWVIAACRTVDPELFFPGPGRNTEQVQAAKAVCAECPARAACLQWALDTGDTWAILGGMTAPERDQLRKLGSRSA